MFLPAATQFNKKPFVPIEISCDFRFLNPRDCEENYLKKLTKLIFLNSRYVTPDKSLICELGVKRYEETTEPQVGRDTKT